MVYTAYALPVPHTSLLPLTHPPTIHNTTHPTQTNAATAVPDNAGAVRGNINSVIFLESVVGGTRVRYVCEVEPKGWLPTVVRVCQSYVIDMCDM